MSKSAGVYKQMVVWMPKRKIFSKYAFSLIEIMVVIAILAILVAVAVPNFLRTKGRANETEILKIIKTFSDACEIYAGQNGAYPTTITSLTGATPPFLVPSSKAVVFVQSYASPNVYHGYSSTLTMSVSGYTLDATSSAAAQDSFSVVTSGKITNTTTGQTLN